MFDEDFEDGDGYDQNGSGDLPVITLKSRDVTVALDDVQVGGVRGPVTPAPHPDDPFMVRHKWWVLGGAVALALLAIILVYMLLFRDTSKTEAVEILIEPSARVTNISEDVANATSIAAFNRAANSVSRGQSAVDSAKQAAQEISNDEVRAGTLALLEAEDGLLAAYDELGALNRLGGDSSAEVTNHVDDAAEELSTAVTSLQAQGLEEAPHPYPNVRAVSGAVHSLKHQLGD